MAIRTKMKMRLCDKLVNNEINQRTQKVQSSATLGVDPHVADKSFAKNVSHSPNQEVDHVALMLTI